VNIQVRGLSKTFTDDRGQVVHAIDDLSLDVENGELMVILGPSGSGKTTLLRCIAGLERADRGKIQLGDRVVFSSSQRIYVPPERRGISMVFQSYALWPHMTAFDNVAYPLRISGVPSNVIRERVAHALDLVGCTGLERRHSNQLSGGQQQRVAIARAIVGGSRVVLFDEPLSSVDARVREELRGELVALQRELAFSSVYITHDQTEAMAIGHRVAVLDSGKIMQISPPRELYSRPATRSVAEFLGAANRFPGTLDTTAGPYWSIDTCAGLGRLLAAHSTSAVGSGNSVTAVVRAEDFKLSTAPPPGDQPNQWGCTVEQSLFLGSCTEYVVDVNGQRVTARSSEKCVLAERASAWLSVAPSDVLVLIE